MKPAKWERREKKRNQKKHGMRVDGKSVMLIVEIVQKRAEKAKEKVTK